jgi:hypothetical protein
VRGRLEDGKFIVLYLKNGVLRAYFALNAGTKELPALQRLIKQGTPLSEKLGSLGDPVIPVKSLL